MKNLAPEIPRQRLLIEGYYGRDVDRQVIASFFDQLCLDLQLRMYGDPVIYSPEGRGKQENQGYDAFVPLIDSGISLYVWSDKQFLACTIYTCKAFDAQTALDTTKAYFSMNQAESMTF